MRAIAQKLALLAAIAASSFHAPAAFARPHKSTHAAVKPAHKAAAKPQRASASKRPVRPERASSKPRKLSRSLRAETPRRSAALHSHTHAAPQVAQSRKLPSAPNVSRPALPPIEVHHDRKQHLPPAQAAPPNPEPQLAPALYTSRGRLIVPPPLKGSHEILIHQNLMADSEGLQRIQDDEDLEQMRAARALVPIPIAAGLRSDERLPPNRRYCRPWTALFLSALAQAHYSRFHTALQVNSAVRTVQFQQQLLRVNGNAAPAEGDTASPHLTGQAVDVAKHGLSVTEIAWMRAYLLPFVQQGKIDVEEEFQQACFHISIYERYVPSKTPNRLIAPRAPASSLAAALP